MKKNEIIQFKAIQGKIFTVRGLQIMVDSDLADLYGVETKQLNKAGKRNVNRFPESFRFQLSEDEYSFLRSQIATSRDKQNLRFQNGTSSFIHGGRRYLPYAFTKMNINVGEIFLKLKQVKLV